MPQNNDSSDAEHSADDPQTSNPIGHVSCWRLAKQLTGMPACSELVERNAESTDPCGKQIEPNASVAGTVPRTESTRQEARLEGAKHGKWCSLFRAAPRNVPDKRSLDYVVKLLNPALAGDQIQRALDRLTRESLAIESVCHPGVIPLLDAGLDRPPFFLVQPWISGGTFLQFLSNKGGLPLTRLLWVVRQVAEVVSAAHETHRAYFGIDPSHVLLGGNGRTTLIGWSYSYGFNQAAPLSVDDLQLARYAAPERFSEDYRAMAESDVYSLGVFIYFALTRRYPIAGSSLSAIVHGHRTHIPIDLSVVWPKCPASLSHLVASMLVKNPLHRPNIQEVLDRLTTMEIQHLDDTSTILH